MFIIKADWNNDAVDGDAILYCKRVTLRFLGYENITGWNSVEPGMIKEPLGSVTTKKCICAHVLFHFLTKINQRVTSAKKMINAHCTRIRLY